MSTAFARTAAAALDDQAQGLRRMFASAPRQHLLPLVQNPEVAFGGVAMERLSAAFADARKHTLVVDAADTASPPQPLARLDLGACIERLAPGVSYLAARGLPITHLDARGSTAGFIDALLQAAPRADVLLVHADASDLCRLFARRTPRPVLLASDDLPSLAPAYAAMKWIAQRLGVLCFDLLIAADAKSENAERIAERLAGCGERFLGAAIANWALVDPASIDLDTVSPALARLASGQLLCGASLHGEAALPLQQPHPAFA